MNNSKVNAYHQNQKASLGNIGNSRETDARALLSAAMQMEAAKNNLVANPKSKDALKQWGEAVRYNQKIWTVFQVAAHDTNNPLPDELRGIMLNLSVYVDQISFRIVGKLMLKEIESLISINRTLAAGLNKVPTGEAIHVPMPDPNLVPTSLMTSA